VPPYLIVCFPGLNYCWLINALDVIEHRTVASLIVYMSVLIASFVFLAADCYNVVTDRPSVRRVSLHFLI